MYMIRGINRSRDALLSLFQVGGQNEWRESIILSKGWTHLGICGGVLFHDIHDIRNIPEVVNLTELSNTHNMDHSKQRHIRWTEH